MTAEKHREISILLDYYGALVSPRQRDALDFYYNDDLSLGEIAENLGVTRQAVRDAVKHGESALFQAEERLGFVSRDAAVKLVAAEISDAATTALQKQLAAELLKIMDK